MIPLSGLDARFLYSETSTAPMQTLKIAVMRIPGAGGGLPDDELMAGVDAYLGRLSPLRRMLLTPPGGFGHPVWVADPHFDVARHVNRRRAAPPGGERELAEVIARVAARPLPRDRPLWNVTVVEGLDDDRVAFVVKLHHAVADGSAAVAMLHHVFAASGAPIPEEPIPPPIPAGSTVAVMQDAASIAAAEYRRDAAAARIQWATARRSKIRHAPGVAARTLAGATAAASARWRASVLAPKPFDGPRTPLNVSLDARRTFAMVDLPMDQVLAVRRAYAVSVNDVYLTLCTAALRGHLTARGVVPDRPLVASVPIATDSEPAGHEPVRAEGNSVDNMYVSLPVGRADPVDRLRAVHEVAVVARDLRTHLGVDLFETRAELTPTHIYPAVVRLWTASRLADHLRPPVNLVASNVAGPRTRLQAGDAELVALYSVGPLLEGVGLNLTAWSYAGRLAVAALGCSRSLPDPWDLVERFRGALAELVESTPSRALSCARS